jgi:radical SAM protein with 4Fe4S-binding SPASM domain
MVKVGVKQADFEGTTFCNLTCRHCMVSAGCKRSELSLREVSEIYKILAHNKVRQLNIWGGEITLRTDFWDMLDMALPAFNVSVQTNGLTNPRLWENQYRDVAVHVSLEGNEQDTDYIRGDGVFKEAARYVYQLAMANAKRKDQKQKITIRTTLMQANELQTSIELAMRLNIDWLGVRFKALGRGGVFEKLAPDTDRMEEIYAMTTHYRKLFPARVMIDEPQYYLYDEYYSTKYWDYFMKRGMVCPLGRRIMIGWDGEAYGCPFLMLEELSFGNLLSDPWSDIIENYQAYLDARQQSELTQKCELCPWKDICGGGCTVYSLYNKHNRIGDPDCPIPQILEKAGGKNG